MPLWKYKDYINIESIFPLYFGREWYKGTRRDVVGLIPGVLQAEWGTQAFLCI